uniref:Uncharacterized protein n=1 Tax=Arundo donax TaxID=35708 RepID=A0A0A8ZBC8_ARUDO
MVGQLLNRQHFSANRRNLYQPQLFICFSYPYDFLLPFATCILQIAG